MHPIVSEFPPIRDAAKAYADAERAIATYQKKVDQARAKQAADVAAALDRGEVLVPPLEVVPDAAVKSHLESRLRAAAAERDSSWSGTADALVPRLEEREAEILTSVLASVPADVAPMVDELVELRDAKAQLLRRHQRAARNAIHGTRFTDFGEIPQTEITVGSVVEAALAGGTLIGRTPPPADAPERTPVFSKQLAGTRPA